MRSVPSRLATLPFQLRQCTWIVPMLRRERAAWMTSHEQPSFFIWCSVASSSVVHLVHLARLFLGFNGAWCTLECAPAS
ncbi:hypothetical protein DL98DRAFT_279358 [Cadophora sp. DSE1049]|nr:hypothetical protein DL98DRAFT_279358 [Cadophora sp. DSE1049]